MRETGKPKALPKVSHDALFRALLENPGQATTLLRDYLPKAFAARMVDKPAKLVDGTYVDKDSRMTQSDRLFEVKLSGGSPALIYALLEHKSTLDAGTPLQLLGYMVRIWTRYAGHKPARLRKLPVILPMVFYHGRAPWTVPQVFGEMVQSDKDSAPFVPSFHYVLHDLADEALSGDAPVRSILTALRYVQRNNEVSHAILTTILRGLPDGSDLEQVAFRYIVERYTVLPDDVRVALDDAKQDGGKALMDTVAEAWKKQAEAEGEAKGLAAGEALGREKGLAEGLLEGETRGKALLDTIAEAWKKQAEAEGEAKGLAAGEALGREKGLTAGEALGREKGLAEGAARGEARAETRSLLRLLVKRFGTLPEPVLAQIAAGSTGELDRWFDTAITAPGLEAVFGERRDH